VVGTGSRATMFIDALTGSYRDSAELVALCDSSQIRMEWHARRLRVERGVAEVPTYRAERFDELVAVAAPDVVIVTTVDRYHHHYIRRSMELGCDVITEKPMTIDVPRMTEIFEAIERTGRELRVTFNYRYAPAFTRLKELILEGRIGRPLAIDFSWLLDIRHGADYFRRWHREKHNSGGLLVHKASHHFDLVNWWIDSFPSRVFAVGDLKFYGRANAESRGERYPYERYTGAPGAEADPFALFLDQKEAFRGLYLDAEEETGYIRDRNVFGDPITIEDTVSLTARYRNGVLLSYSLLAYAPWEGLRVAVTGDRGRVELDVVESVEHLHGDGDAALASKGPHKTATIRVQPMFQPAYEVEVPARQGGHGGADPVMLEHLFAPDPPADPLHRAATHVDGAAAILLGIAANESIATGEAQDVDALFDLGESAERGRSRVAGAMSSPVRRYPHRTR
jgi:predicted dehydrogenase